MLDIADDGLVQIFSDLRHFFLVAVYLRYNERAAVLRRVYCFLDGLVYGAGPRSLTVRCALRL